MGFLDNLENSLNALERQDERDGSQAQRMAEERNRKLAAEPTAELLKNSPWTKDLFDKAAVAGHKIRAKIYIAWIQSALRLEAKGRMLDLAPGPEGVVARYEKEGLEVTEPVDFASDPNDLLFRWLGDVK
jgi:hypothetical protein